ncbi:hypothetical protein B6A27_09950 [Anoxybacillus sp. UARK-01]|nr:hypothetical protein B6A27_09950 [Anoxybacillus sp. UARK-01]
MEEYTNIMIFTIKKLLSLYNNFVNFASFIFYMTHDRNKYNEKMQAKRLSTKTILLRGKIVFDPFAISLGGRGLQIHLENASWSNEAR